MTNSESLITKNSTSDDLVKNKDNKIMDNKVEGINMSIKYEDNLKNNQKNLDQVNIK